MHAVNHSTAPAPAVQSIGSLGHVDRWAREVVRTFADVSPGTTVGLAVIKAEEALARPLTMDETTVLVQAIEREWNARPESIKANATANVVFVVEDNDDGCPVGDPDCEGGDADCHDACERPERLFTRDPSTPTPMAYYGEGADHTDMECL